jgi:hypothetical protein
MSSAPPPSPTPPAVPPATSTHGGKLIAASWHALRQDRELLAMPVIGAVAALAAMLPIALVGVFVPQGATAALVALGVVAVVVMTVITTFFAVALAAGAHERLNGGDPTVRSAVDVAWSRRWTVVRWALLSVTVGLVLRLLQEKLGNAGTVLRFLGGAAWAIASFFTIPVIAANAVGPIEALTISTTTFKQRWSSAARVQLRLGLYVLGLVLAIVVAVVIVVALAAVAVPLAIVVAIVLAAACLGAMLVLSAVTAYSRVVLYRYASGLPTPGFATASLDAAVTVKS